MIAVDGLTKSFGTHTVLKGVGFSLPPGGVTALIGPSGGGKSTLLRCINLLEQPESGTLTVGDRTLVFHPKKSLPKDEVLGLRRKTGMIFQSFQLFPHRTAVQNVMEGLVTVLGWKPDRAKNRALELLERVGLPEKSSAYPLTLSGGQQQRVAIARALALSPEVLLCDEPTSALDPELAAEVVEVLKGLARDGMTMMIATHDLRLARSVAREVLFLDGGTIVEAGAPEQLFARPVQPRTQAFVATITGTVADGSEV